MANASVLAPLSSRVSNWLSRRIGSISSFLGRAQEQRVMPNVVHSAWSSVGLSNKLFANNCFFNSAMQVFMRLEKFRALPPPSVGEDPILPQLRDFISTVYPTPQSSTIDPIGLRAVFAEQSATSDIVFPLGEQQDVAEFINVFLDRTESSGLLREARFTIKTTAICTPCGTPSTPIENREHEVHATFPAKVAKGQIFELADMMKSMFGQETIHETECETCPRHVAKKDRNVQPTNPPEILLVQIFRFSRHSKIENKVNVPFNLEFGRNYRLHGVVNHEGTSPADGHYTATVRDSESGDWFLYDDSDVSVVDDDQVVTSSAYYVVYTAVPEVVTVEPELDTIALDAFPFIDEESSDGKRKADDADVRKAKRREARQRL